MKLPLAFRQMQPLPGKLLVGLGIALALLLALGAFSYRNLQRQAAAADLVAHTYQVTGTLQAAFSSLQEMESAQRAFLISGNETYLEPYHAAVAKLPDQLAFLRSLTVDNPLQTTRLAQFSADIDRRLELIRLRIDQRRQMGAAILNVELLQGKGVALMKVARQDVTVMIAEEERLLRGRLAVLMAARTRSVWLQTLGGVASIGLLLTVFAGLVKQIQRANRAEREAQRINAQLEDANNEMRTFSYSVAHDLRAPLRAINGFSQVIVEDHAAQLDPEARRVLGRISANATTMGRLIDDLLSLSKVSSQPIQSAKVDMSDVVRGVYEELMESYPGRIVECEIASLPPASGDASLLRQVWVNLIGNALKFTRGTGKARIEIGGNVAGPEFATYYIRDNGAGFDMQYAGKLFGAFQRLHRPGEFEGTGIGLALVQRIIHRHGGTIWAEGTEGQGARFAFTLPEWAGN